MINKEAVKDWAKQYFDELISIRRHLHANPELSYKEFNTAKYISSLLTEWGIEHQTGVGGNGIVGLIKGIKPDKKTIALRADMDALPISEQNQVDYKSTNKGVMHACGHDVHTTCLLGTAKFLTDHQSQFEGTVKLIFQHAEEKAPGGAIQMIEAGALENPVPSAVFGQHVIPELESGKIGIKSGKFMASSDEINLYITGSGGHAAMPDKNDDTVLATAHIIVALQHIVSRKADPKIPTILSFGQIITDGAMNIFPEEVSVHGTFRTYDEAWREKAHQLIRKTAENTAKAYGVHCNVIIDEGYPFLINDEKLTSVTMHAAAEFVGQENIVEMDARMTAEDFARYSHLLPSCFYRLGTGNQKEGIISGLHTPTFNVDENSIETGTGLMIWIALSQLYDNS